MLITITDLRSIDGQLLKELGRTRFALCKNNTMILSMTQEGACQALNLRRAGEPADQHTPVQEPIAREPTLDELRAWFKWQTKHGRTNQRYVEGGLPWQAND